MPHLLELFCGTKSVGRVFERRGWTCCSLDMDKRCEPTICCNILDVTPEAILAHGKPDCIWASPLCTHYSMARTNARMPRDLEGSDRLVQAVLNLAAYFGCPFFMENPWTGLLKSRAVVAGIPMRIVDYCQCADEDFPGRYRKRTAVWTNTAWQPARGLCVPSECHFCADGKRHDHSAQRGGNGRTSQSHSLNQLYSIPEGLPEELLLWLTVASV